MVYRKEIMAAIRMLSEVSWRWMKKVVRTERSLEVFNGVALGMAARDGARDGLGVSGLGSRIVTAYTKAIEREMEFRRKLQVEFRLAPRSWGCAK